MISDAELVRAAQRGDAASLGMLLERYCASLHSLALKSLGYGPDAQDAVHDTFLVAVQKLDQVREPAAVGRWLHTVLRNVCRMRLRADHGDLLLSEAPWYAETISSMPSVEQYIERLALRDWVWTALATLPETLQVTAMLRYFGGQTSYEELSAILGVPVGTVKSRLNQVKLKLAEALLDTASLAHLEAAEITKGRERHFTEALDEFNHGKGYGRFVAALSEDVVLTRPGGEEGRGRSYLITWLQRNLEAGIKLHIVNVFASKDITILEGRYENPPDDPFHCPPVTTHVYMHRHGMTHRLQLYYPPSLAQQREGTA